MDGAVTADTSLTDLIQRAQSGDEAAYGAVFEAAYEDLRALAHARLRGAPRGAVLDTTSVVHESYLRFVQSRRLDIQDRGHFLRYAARIMRSVIVDFIRERMAQCRGADAPHVTLTTHVGAGSASGAEEILRVHEALEEIAALDPRIVQVVEMRYFAGMTEVEIADALGVTDRTVRRTWEKARLLLAQSLKAGA